ncbi:MAG: hypothetical protein HQK55_07715 [Deltaproteobacteria bacterium]|nr:hypothetical protein [Deltaproteobacteria bacterium]
MLASLVKGLLNMARFQGEGGTIMSRLITAVLLAFVMFGPGAGLGLAADAAMVVDQSGPEAKYDVGPKTGTPVNLMDFLSDGDRIDLPSGGRLVLNYFSSGKREDITGAGKLTVSQAASQAGPGIKVISSQAASPPPQSVVDDGAQKAGMVAFRSSSLKSSTQKGGAKPAGGKLDHRLNEFQTQTQSPSQIAPATLFQTAILPGKPVFSWKPVNDATKYTVKVYAGANSLWESETDRTPMTYAGPQLNPGTKYKWTITALNGSKEIARGGSEFWVLSADKAKEKADTEARIRKTSLPDSPEVQIGQVMLYQKYELYDEAAVILQGLVKKYPKNQQMAKQLKLLSPGLTL